MANTPESVPVGAHLVLEVGPVAHGGHCVARHHGQVVFVRHTLPGEQVRAVVTEVGAGGKFLRADAVDVLRAAPERVPAPCPWAGPGLCGGCDWQHVDLVAQRDLKAAVVVEQFARLADLDLTDHLGHPVPVEAVPGDQDGLGWRTRVEFAVDQGGRPGLRRHRSHDIVPIEDCLIADGRVIGTGVLGTTYPGATAVDVVAPSVGHPVIVEVPGEDPPVVRERVAVPGGDLELGVSARGFWQVHPGAATTFVTTVLDWLQPRAGEHAVDLYAGVGLFAAALADRVGTEGSVLAIESDRVATDNARGNLAQRPWVRVQRDRVDRAVRRLLRSEQEIDLVVLDPPRTGAGRQVCRDIAGLRPRSIGYVACDPAALARDVGYLSNYGYRLRDLRAFDAFPMTHHMELVAVLDPV
ncbi:class I SAM-dependent RNA methyltransferase [Ornithinimicrobium cryptoxanthini]|uniref:TRAM domain-containing protein n=1 Tax=Ornithinimicrobium cryptoxanthini TaxID=2934161 RepID=A0ABY4YLG2_9MICO|nr:TRAM domain-containing protein [Ornithinimicrobium cryptoxanthini]USQ77632.1 TRAM domain-containing protein [Ornithinimicrobium cryptoxanthini]